MPADFAPGGRLPPLTDRAGRQYRYLRLSVTDRCNMACVYCMPPEGEAEHALRRDVLSFEQIARLTGVFSQMGIRRVRFTGGEPLIRKHVVDLLAQVHAQSTLDALWLTTNGVRLANLAEPLKAAGLTGVNVSIDSLDPDRFRRLTRGAELAPVLAGINAASAAGLQVKLNTVALRGENEDELGARVDFAWEIGAIPRFIELMPLGGGAALLASHHLPTSAVLARIGARVLPEAGTRDPAAGPAHYYMAADGSGNKVGIIGAISDKFCENCNRIRLTSRGEILACIASRSAMPLKDLMERGQSDAELAWAVHVARQSKRAGHEFELSSGQQHGRGMSLVGG